MGKLISYQFSFDCRAMVLQSLEMQVKKNYMDVAQVRTVLVMNSEQKTNQIVTQKPSTTSVRQ